MFKLKSPKVFEKLNKLNRKQAYTIGAIVVVLVVALILLISAATSGDDDSFAGMNARGYDLAQMPFATDEAEKYLLANAYPDMQENGSTLLYSKEEKEQRQEEDALNEEGEGEEEENTESSSSSGNEDEYEYGSGSSRGYGSGGYGGSGRGGSKTEIGTLSNSGMASAGGSGVNSTWGPAGDFHQFKGREDRGKERPVQLKTDDARRSLAQFRSGSIAAARINENKMKNAGKALFGGDIKGSDAFKDGVDLSKLAESGLTLDTSAPSTTTDLNNLDKKVADAVKDKEKKEEKKKEKEWWEEMLIDLAKSSAKLIVDSFLGTAMDTLSANISASSARRGAKNGVYRDESDRLYAGITDAKTAAEMGIPESKIKEISDRATKNNRSFREQLDKDMGQKGYYNNYGQNIVKHDEVVIGRANEEGNRAYNEALGRAWDSNAQRQANNNNNNNNNNNTTVNCPKGKTYGWNEEKQQLGCW